jgi:predicted phosphodiesterase
MRIGIFSDIHGNVEALKQCLVVFRDMGIEELYFLGDAVGYFPWENEVLDILRSLRAVCIKGNHEAMLLEELPLLREDDQLYGLKDARHRISKKNLKFIQKWPNFRELSFSGRRVFLVHGSPNDHLSEYVYPNSDLSFVNEYNCQGFFLGHTHCPFIVNQGVVHIVNVGSCGLPRDQGNLSSIAVYDTRSHRTQILRLQFNLEEHLRDTPESHVSREVRACLRRRCANPFGTKIRRGRVT